ncbi:MAG TPA: hypothetical protein VFO31_03495 [Vicinamibacterales bacterium]|nr:hypothetical protein [Vicinamibacterales bacterium]
MYVAWRHVYPGNVRDIAFTMSNDGGKTFAAPIRVSDDRWVLDGCPEKDPALAVDAHRRVDVVWPTLVPPAGAAGLRWLEQPSATYPVVAVTSEGLLVAWTSGSQSNAVVRLTRLMR